MRNIDLWQYTVWLVAIRYLLPIAVVLLFTVTGLNLANIGIPYLAAIVAAAITGRATAQAVGFMPEPIEVLLFACMSSLLFFTVSYIAYVLLAVSGIGPVDLYLLEYWHRSGHIVQLMAMQFVFALFCNSVILWLAAKTELRAMVRQRRKEQAL